MTNPTALDSWGANRENADAGEDGHDVNEHDIRGDHEPDDSAVDAELAHEADADTGQVTQVDDDAERHAAKKKKDMKMLMVAGGVAGALVIGVVGLGVVKALSNSGQQNVVQQEQQSPVVQPAQGGRQDVIVERQDGSPVVAQVGGQLGAPAAAAPPAPDFGLQGANTQGNQAPQMSAVDLPPAATPVVPAAPHMTAAVAAPLAPPVMAPTATASPSGAAPAAPVAALTPKTSAAAPAVDAAEVSSLRGELDSLRSELGSKAKALEDVQRELAELRKMQARAVVNRPATAPVRPVVVAKASAPKFAPIKKPIAEPAKVAPAPEASPIKETVVAQVAVPSPVAVAAAKGKVRSDFRIYAIADGRVWVMGQDNEAIQIGARSPLADGSRVTGIDADKHVVYTTAGEIR